MSNQCYKQLVFAEDIRQVNGIPVAIGYTAADGNQNYRLGLGLGVFIEVFPSATDRRFSLVFGASYRQKGFINNSQLPPGVVGQVPGRTNNRLDHISFDLAERFYFKSYYLFLGVRYDRLVNSRLIPALTELFTYYHRDEVSPLIGAGHFVNLGKAKFFIELEVNPGLQNMIARKNYTIGFYNTHLSNFVAGINVAYCFGRKAITPLTAKTNI